MSVLKILYSFFVVFLLIASFQAVSEGNCRPDFFLTPLEELELSPETANNLQNKGVRTFSDLLTEEEKELTGQGQLKSLLNRLQEALALRAPPPINIQEIQRIFSLKANYAKYRGQEGYLLFMKRTPNANRMNYVFELVSKALGEDFKQLGWQAYHGSTEGFSEEREQILNSDESVKEEYKGMSGYARYAKEYHGKAMQKAFQNVSSVLESSLFDQLGWQQYHGFVEEFSEEREQILNSDESVKKEYKGMSGYARYAKEYHGKSMLKAFINVSSVLESSLFDQLGWQGYHGSTEEFSKEREQILNSDGSVKEKYKGMSGYARYAKRYHGKSMHKTFQNVSSVLESSLFEQLGWQQYHGFVEEFSKEREQILNSDGSVKEKYKGMSGYARYAEKYHGKAMQKAFQNVSSVLESSLFEQLGWQAYHGSTEGFSEEREQILNSDGSVKKEYKGMSGYARYAEKYHGKVMLKAFVNVSSVLESSLFDQLGWQAYQGSVEGFSEEREQILNSDGSVKKEYKGMSGYGKYAKKYHGGNMQKAFLNVSSVLGGYWGMKEIGLNWKQFKGSVLEYDNLLQLFEVNRAMDFAGIEGQRKVADKVFGGDKKRAYLNVSIFREILVGSKKPLKDTMGWLLNLR